MNTDQLSGKWKQMKGAAKQHWGKLTDDDLEVIAGKRDALIGKLQERYGMAREEAQRKADEWLKTNNMAEEQTAFGRSHQEAGHEQHSASKR
jgi:uncharacterized protein YjbJ (UPF0337 family)